MNSVLHYNYLQTNIQQNINRLSMMFRNLFKFWLKKKERDIPQFQVHSYKHVKRHATHLTIHNLI